jgi:N-acetylglucosamine kinase-like BadF-type ATPase
MPAIKLIADCGSTKTEWCLLKGKKKTIFNSTGMSPYFVSDIQMEDIIRREVMPQLKKSKVEEVHYYSTGCGNIENVKMVRKTLKTFFPGSLINVETDITGAARALCGNEKGVVCILGTGSSACYYNGKRIIKNRPGLGFILGDEGSGAYLGKKVIQYYLYDTLDDDLRARFDAKFVTNTNEILDAVYKQPFANRYLASFAIFLAENRGNYMIENIIEDGLTEFFITHIRRFSESWKFPVHFTGGIAFGFRDVCAKMCKRFNFQIGNIMKNPMEGLVTFHA